jgi:hypothetical protein
MNPQEQWSLAGQPPPNDEAVPWSRSNHVLETRLLPVSDDSDKNLSRTLEKPELS